MAIKTCPERAIETEIFFLKRNARFEFEKPYAFRYPVDTVPQTNMAMEQTARIPMTDMRGFEEQFSLDFNGFTIMKLESELPYSDFYDEVSVNKYFRQLEKLLKSHLGANLVEIFRHGLRKRHPDFPISTGESYDYDQPTSVAHVDTTPQEMLEEVRRRHGKDANTLLNGRVQWVNIWKPLKGPLNDWPLAICDASTVHSSDLEAADLLYPDLATENFQVYHNPHHKWYYLSEQKTSEVIVFKQSDTQTRTCLGVPHCSFFNPFTPDDESPRESIEVRALVYYGEEVTS